MYIVFAVVKKDTYNIISYLLLFGFFVTLISYGEIEKFEFRINIFKILSKYSFTVYLVHYSIIDFYYNLISNISISIFFAVTTTMVSAVVLQFVIDRFRIVLMKTINLFNEGVL